jgi:hypothetical protein
LTLKEIPLGESLKVSASLKRGRMSFPQAGAAVNARACDFEATKPWYWRGNQRPLLELPDDDIDALRERIRRAKQAG